jgi:hypothetical protein
MSALKLPSLGKVEGLAVIVGLAVGAFVLWRVVRAVPGIVSGDNALTRGATDAAGNPTTAYVDVPIFGTAGAAANAASGGWLASVGDWLGSHAYDLTHDDPNADDSSRAKDDLMSREIDFGAGGGW